ncbi:MAG: restriction endonuclease [Phycisphaeraceae bacterium]|nr:restriction endonuclease [Phycisphaeraceae bacterium]
MSESGTDIAAPPPNALYYGDNLPLLRDRDLFPNESVDLIYLDPPFNSNATYNVLFKESSGESSTAQIKAFDDTWSWDASAAEALALLMHDKDTPPPVVTLMRTFHQFMGHTPMLAYLVQMAARLVHMRRILRPAGSIYLHCDPTASHYLKIVLDGIFGAAQFRNEIVWKRTSGRVGPTRYGRVHDIILFFGASESITWNAPSTPQDATTAKGHDLVTDDHGETFRVSDLSAMGPGPARRFGKKSIAPPKGRHWQFDQAGVDQRWASGRIRLNSKGVPRLYTPLGELPGIAIHDVWSDIEPINAAAQERLHYPTQKPLALLRRIIAASSKPGDVVLDPFCGCGTTIDAVESLNRESPKDPPRRWIGIDVTHLAINLIKYRLRRFDPSPRYVLRGEPTDLAGATQLFKDDPFQFQYWACGLVGARPAVATESGRSAKKGADRGIDGVRFFVDDNKGPKSILVQVKGGRVGSKDIRDFRGTLEREHAVLGLFVSLNAPTKPMLAEAATVPPYTSPVDGSRTPALQVVTVESLLAGGTPVRPAGIALPPSVEFDRTVKRAKSFDEATLFSSAN